MRDRVVRRGAQEGAARCAICHTRLRAVPRRLAAHQQAHADAPLRVAPHGRDHQQPGRRAGGDQAAGHPGSPLARPVHAVPAAARRRREPSHRPGV